MKTTIRNLMAAIILLAVSLQAYAQGTLVYDQQSATEPVAVVGNGNADGLYIQEDSPLVQSFIPTLSAIEFAQLEFEDPLLLNNGNNGATVYVNLWSGSPDPRFDATLLGSTVAVYMPNGFENGPNSTGVTNFYFPTSITLTPGQTYYLQPVVQSGDDPWPIVTIGDTYSDGQVFVKGAGYNTDFWFREGIVPEPSALVLAGLSGLLVFIFKRRFKFVILLSFAAPVLSIHALADSVVQATADEAGLTSVSATSLPHTGTFWVMTVGSNGHLIALPYPSLPSNLSTLPIYSVAGKGFIVDDTGGQLIPSSAGLMNSAQAASIAQTQVTAMDMLLGQILYPGTNGFGTNGIFQPNGSGSMIDTNGLWLENLNIDPTNVWLRLHNPIDGDNYQLLSTSNLLDTNWDLGEILSGSYDSYVDFTPVPMTNAITFFKVHHANPDMEIDDGEDSEELNPTNTSNPGHSGYIYIYNNGSQTNDVTVYYSIGGTAENGIDYSNLTGEVVVPLDSYYAQIDIDPIADGFKPDQTVILTLLQNTNYLIDPANYSATNILTANPEVYPTVNGDLKQLCPNNSLTLDLSADANDPRGLPLTYSIVTWPTHGTLDTNSLPSVTYTPTNCYEGQDSFTFTASDGQFTSAPATVTLIIADPVSASPVTPQTCRGTPVGFALNGSDNCSETLSYALLSNPLYGSVTNVSGSPTDPNYVYTPYGTNFTGTDSFNYIAYSGCGGDFATNTVTITVGNSHIIPDAQKIMTGTNQPVAITLSGEGADSCNNDTNYYTYTVTGNLTNGYLTGTPPNLIYWPTNGEGYDSFQFDVSDGVLPPGFPPVRVELYVVAGPILTLGCYPFGTSVQLNWTLDQEATNLEFNYGMVVSGYIVYRSAYSGGPYTAIATNSYGQMSYSDNSAVIGQTNYYVVTIKSQYHAGDKIYESSYSNEIGASGQNPDDLIAPNAIWNVVTNLDDPTSVTNLQAPFSSYGTNQYPGLYPLPNTLWPVGTTWSNHITMFIPSNSVPLSQVFYSIAIDNNYQLYLNDSNAPIEIFNHEGPATWSSLKPFEDVAPGLLHYGTNDIRVVIVDEAGINYFSMIVTTNTCGW